MKEVGIVFTDHNEYDGYTSIIHENVMFVTTHPSGLVLSIELANGSMIHYPWSRIRSVRVS